MVCRLIPTQAALVRADRPRAEGHRAARRGPRGLLLVTGPDGLGQDDDARDDDQLHQRERGRATSSRSRTRSSTTTSTRSRSSRSARSGRTCPTFAEAIRRALRQDPDVILLGEMRDLETIATAITAAETGHLVFGTLHTTGSARTVDRIIDPFPPDQQEQIRVQLSVSIIAVISQVLDAAGRREGRRRGVRGHGDDARDREPHPQERDLQDHQRHPDEPQARACCCSTTTCCELVHAGHDRPGRRCSRTARTRGAIREKLEPAGVEALTPMAEQPYRYARTKKLLGQILKEMKAVPRGHDPGGPRGPEEGGRPDRRASSWS